jgi:5-methyltetrahydrofolate--homocysteine methyltransferase
MAGTMLLSPLDLHTNLDLVAAARGPQRLCLDLIDRPELIDQAMDDARAIFRELWAAVARAGRMDELGYCHAFYSPEGAAVLQCDFSCMISPAMFRRWVLPALEEEAAIVRHALYHWDGPGALVHTADLLASQGLFSMSYVPGAGHGEHIDYLDLFQLVQAGGKAVQVHGTPEQIKSMHGELRPEKVHYHTHCNSVADAEALLAWFVRNT